MMSAQIPEDRLSYLIGVYEQMDKRLGTLEVNVSGIRHDIASLGDKLDARFARIDARFERVDARFERFLSEVNAQFNTLNANIDVNLRWSIGSILAVGASIVASAIASAFLQHIH